MSMTQAEILESLNLVGSPARVVVELSSRELSPERMRAIFVQFAGEDTFVREPLLNVTVKYLVVQAASGQPLDVAACIAQGEAYAAKNPWEFTEAVLREAAALRATEEKAKPKPPKDDDDSEGTPVIDREGTAPFKRGRPAPGQKSAFQQATELLTELGEHTREQGIALLQEKLGLGFGSAQTYFYKAKAERANATE